MIDPYICQPRDTEFRTLLGGARRQPADAHHPQPGQASRRSRGRRGYVSGHAGPDRRRGHRRARGPACPGPCPRESREEPLGRPGGLSRGQRHLTARDGSADRECGADHSRQIDGRRAIQTAVPTRSTGGSCRPWSGSGVPAAPARAADDRMGAWSPTWATGGGGMPRLAPGVTGRARASPRCRVNHDRPEHQRRRSPFRRRALGDLFGGTELRPRASQAPDCSALEADPFGSQSGCELWG